VYLKIVNANAGSTLTVTLGSGIRALASLGTEQTIVIPASSTGTMAFICDGTSLLELSRILQVAAA
jgi:hypothetical protein